jgi:hypothetical protein
MSCDLNQMHFSIIQSSSFLNNSKPDAIVDSGIIVLALLSYVHSKEAY